MYRYYSKYNIATTKKNSVSDPGIWISIRIRADPGFLRSVSAIRIFCLIQIRGKKFKICRIFTHILKSFW